LRVREKSEESRGIGKSVGKEFGNAEGVETIVRCEYRVLRERDVAFIKGERRR
jgi:hypothetical protein